MKALREFHQRRQYGIIFERVRVSGRASGRIIRSMMTHDIWSHEGKQHVLLRPEPAGSLSDRLTQTRTAAQPDPHSWMHKIRSSQSLVEVMTRTYISEQ